MSECNCSMRQQLVGDGCHICNPEMAKDLSESNLVYRLERLESFYSGSPYSGDKYNAELLYEARRRIEKLEIRELGYIQSLRELEARVRELDWISVEDRLPSDDLKQVCVWEADYERVSVCEFPKGWAGMLKHKYITHWMPLPEPPRAD